MEKKYLNALSSGADISARKELMAKIQAAYPPARVTGTLAKKSHSFLESKYTAQKTRMICEMMVAVKKR